MKPTSPLIPIFVLALAIVSCAGPDKPQAASKAPASPPANSMSLTVPLKLVRSLQPTFEWSRARQGGVSYDFVVYGAMLKETPGQPSLWVPAKEAYYREGLNVTRHTLDQPLQSNTIYFWSVRTRSGTNVSPWAAYSDPKSKAVSAGARRFNMLSPFKTP